MRGTHSLETAEGGPIQYMEGKPLSKTRSLPEDSRERDKSGHGMEATERGALTLWRPHREGQVRTQKESS